MLMMIRSSLLLLLILVLPCMAVYGQVAQFRADSIPVVGNEVVFQVDFESELSKGEIRNAASAYLNDVLNPYAGAFHASSDDHTVCRITDYVSIGNNLFQSVGMYMTYDLSLVYKDGACTLVIWGINYVEKQYYEAQEASSRDLFIPVHPAIDIMVGKTFKVMTVKNASERITEASIERFNGMVRDLDALFSKTD